jgi:ribosomal protein S27AE
MSSLAEQLDLHKDKIDKLVREDCPRCATGILVNGECSNPDCPSNQ